MSYRQLSAQGQRTRYLPELARYVVLNPVLGAMVKHARLVLSPQCGRPGVK